MPAPMLFDLKALGLGVCLVDLEILSVAPRFRCVQGFPELEDLAGSWIVLGMEMGLVSRDFLVGMKLMPRSCPLSRS